MHPQKTRRKYRRQIYTKPVQILDLKIHTFPYFAINSCDKVISHVTFKTHLIQSVLFRFMYEKISTKFFIQSMQCTYSFLKNYVKGMVPVSVKRNVKWNKRILDKSSLELLKCLILMSFMTFNFYCIF